MVKLQHERPMALVVAGFDPSGGAGLVADIRAMEQRGVLAHAAISGNTFQTDALFSGVEWMEEASFRQLELLCNRYNYRAVKIGLIPSFNYLEQLLNLLDRLLPGVPTIWDPILSASAGFNFHTDQLQHPQNRQQIGSLLKRLSLTTPNLEEFEKMFGPFAECQTECLGYSLLVKSVRERPGEIADIWMDGKGRVFPFWKPKIPAAAKHGTGCLLSSLITAGVASGETIEESCLNSLPYFEQYLRSSSTLLGYWSHNSTSETTP